MEGKIIRRRSPKPEPAALNVLLRRLPDLRCFRPLVSYSALEAEPRSPTTQEHLVDEPLVFHTQKQTEQEILSSPEANTDAMQVAPALL